MPSGVPSMSRSPSVSVEPSSVAPTPIPDGAIYYDGFEGATFPSDSEWETGGDLPWELTTAKANGGLYSIRSANVTTTDGSKGVSSVTLTINSTWGAGVLYFAALPSTESPHDRVTVHIDGQIEDEISDELSELKTEFGVYEIQLSAGVQNVTFVYEYNPFRITIFPPLPEGYLGAIFLDDVYFVAVSGVPSGAPSISESPTTTGIPSQMPTGSQSPSLSSSPSVRPTSSPAPSMMPSGSSSPTILYQPSQSPSLSFVPTELASAEPSGFSAAPTAIPPDGAIYYDSFEQALFPSDLWGTDGTEPWGLSKAKAKSLSLRHRLRRSKRVARRSLKPRSPHRTETGSNMPWRCNR